jgi:hypothetical protein
MAGASAASLCRLDGPDGQEGPWAAVPKVVVHKVSEVAHVACQPVQLDDDKCVRLASSQRQQRFLQTRPIQRLGRVAFIDYDID